MENNNKEKNRFWYSIPKRLLFIVCITVIPINIIAVMVSSIVIKESRERISASYQSKLELYMNNKESLIKKIDESFGSFLGANKDIMSVQGENNSILSMDFAQELGSIINTYDIQGFTYLWEQKGESKLYLKCNKRTYSYKEVEELKEKFILSYDKDYPTTNWRIINLDDRYYYFCNYSYTKYKIGFGIDLQMVFLELFEDKGIYLVLESGDDRLILQSDGTLTAISKSEMDKYITPGLNRSVVSWQSDSEKNKFNLVVVNTSFWKYVPLIYWILQVVAFLSILGIVILWKSIRKQVIYPLTVIYGGMKKIEENSLEYRITEKAQTKEFEYIFDAFNRMSSDILKSHEKDILMFQIEITNLRLQVNPHMLLNSFNMIYSLAETKNYQCIQEYSIHLVEYFRYVLKENESLVPLTSEMKFVTSFIEIQKIRFPGEFSSVYKIEDGLNNALVPPLIIENFVENSMKYAGKPDQEIEVLINIRKENDKLIITICDTGKGMEKEVLDSVNHGNIYIDSNGMKHIGIWNCRRRLETFFGEIAVLKITSVRGEGTQVWMEFPYITREDGQFYGAWNQSFTRDVQKGAKTNELIDC